MIIKTLSEKLAFLAELFILVVLLLPCSWEIVQEVQEVHEIVQEDLFPLFSVAV